MQIDHCLSGTGVSRSHILYAARRGHTVAQLAEASNAAFSSDTRQSVLRAARVGVILEDG